MFCHLFFVPKWKELAVNVHLDLNSRDAAATERPVSASRRPGGLRQHGSSLPFTVQLGKRCNAGRLLRSAMTTVNVYLIVGMPGTPSVIPWE